MRQSIITTERLMLRPYETADRAAVQDYAADAEVSQYQAWGPNTAEQTREFVARCVEASQEPEGKGYFYVVVLRDTTQVIGGCNLSYTDTPYDEAMIGYTIGKPYWGRGYTTEAAYALLQLGFETLHLHRIVSHCDVLNVGSWRVMEKIGMRREAHEIESVWFKNQWHDWLRYALLSREWRQSKQASSVGTSSQRSAM